MDNIQKSIGENLKRLRKSRGFSLDETSERTGVSKAMLGQIERGESNPTVSTLWKIAKGLQVSFSTLIKDEQSNIEIIKLETITPVIENNGMYRVFPLFPFDPRKKFEIFLVQLDVDCEHIAESHSEGVEEYITVIDGTLEVEINGQTTIIEKGDSIRFPANQPHIYRNKGNTMTTYHLVLHYQ